MVSSFAIRESSLLRREQQKVIVLGDTEDLVSWFVLGDTEELEDVRGTLEQCRVKNEQRASEER